MTKVGSHSLIENCSNDLMKLDLHD